MLVNALAEGLDGAQYATEMALCVLTYNLTRVLNIVGVENLMEAIKA